MKVRLDIEWGEMPLGDRDKVGVCKLIAPGEFKINIASDEPMLDQVGTLFHEFGHLVFWTLLAQDWDAQQEHKFCDRVDGAARRAFKKFLEGK